MRRRRIALGARLRFLGDIVPKRLPLVVLVPDVSTLIEGNEILAAVLKDLLDRDGF
jgi:hypothetical protein